MEFRLFLYFKNPHIFGLDHLEIFYATSIYRSILINFINLSKTNLDFFINIWFLKLLCHISTIYFVIIISITFACAGHVFKSKLIVWILTGFCFILFNQIIKLFPQVSTLLVFTLFTDVNIFQTTGVHFILVVYLIFVRLNITSILKNGA